MEHNQSDRSTGQTAVQKKKSPLWAFLSPVLIAVGLFFRFALRGYVYWGYLCFFLIALILAHRFLPLLLWRVVLGLTCLGIVYFCIVEVPIVKNARTDPDPERPYLIVLGAQVRPSGLSVALKSRLDAAYDYLIENENTTCIVSGGQGPNEPMTEADAMAGYLIERGLDPNRIIRENQSTNTSENIRNSMSFINPANDHVAIVTNDYHLFRGMAIARKQGIAHVSGIAAGATPWYLPNNMARESFGLAKDFVFVNL